MTQLLPIYLSMVEHAGDNEKKRLIAQIPKETREFDYVSKTWVKPRELLLTEAVESTSLIQTEIYRTMVEGSQPAVCFRNALPTVQMPSKTMTIDYGAAGSYLSKVAEAAEIPQGNENPTPVTLTAQKFAEAPTISQELIDDGVFDVIEMEIKRVGLAAENTLNRRALSRILENSGTEHDCTGSNLGIKALASTRGKVTTGDYTPTVAVLNPEAETQLLLDVIPTASYYKEDNSFATGRLGSMLGMDLFSCGVTVDSDISSTYTWGYAADGEIGMLVMDKERAGVIGMRQDMMVKDYEDVIKDLKGFTVTMRFDVQPIHTSATARCEY